MAGDDAELAVAPGRAAAETSIIIQRRCAAPVSLAVSRTKHMSFIVTKL